MQVQGTGHGPMRHHRFPGIFHFPAPVNIIHYEHRTFMQLRKDLDKIPLRGFAPVVAVEKNKIQFSGTMEHFAECFIKIALDHLHVL